MNLYSPAEAPNRGYLHAVSQILLKLNSIQENANINSFVKKVNYVNYPLSIYGKVNRQGY